MNQDTVPEIFDRRRRRALHNRAESRQPCEAFLLQHMADALTDQLAYVSRPFDRALFIGPIGKWAQQILAGRNTQLHLAALCEAGAAAGACDIIEEDRLPYDPASFDLIITAGSLDSVNDLPGALVQIRRTLRPDGLLLSVMFGAGTLATLRTVLMRADGDKAAAHIHPQIDLRTAADLLSRAGFALPVADSDTLLVRYGNWRALISDIRDTGTGNALAGPRTYHGKAWPRLIGEEWDRHKDSDGKVTEHYIFVNLSAWSPSPDQQKPARRGSGTVSLADALSRKNT